MWLLVSAGLGSGQPMLIPSPLCPHPLCCLFMLHTPMAITSSSSSGKWERPAASPAREHLSLSLSLCLSLPLVLPLLPLLLFQPQGAFPHSSHPSQLQFSSHDSLRGWGLAFENPVFLCPRLIPWVVTGYLHTCFRNQPWSLGSPLTEHRSFCC